MEAQTRSYFDTCFNYWWQACNYQIGFMCVGEFNSIISDSVVSMSKVNNSTQSHYLYFVEETVEPEPEPTPDPTPTPNPAPGEEEEEEEEEENENNKNQGSRAVTVASPKGNGIIYNPLIQSSRNNDSTYYQQFVVAVK